MPDTNRTARKWRVPSLWSLLDSMRFAIWVLAILTVVSTVGVIIPQDAPRAAYLEKYGKVLGEVLVLLGFDHLFRTGWYVGLWALVVASLLVCSFKRLPGSLRAAFGKPILRSPEPFEGRELGAQFAVGSRPDGALSAAARLLRKRGFRIHREGEALLGYRGGLERLGPFITHVSIAVVLVGGMIASVTRSDHDQPAKDGDVFEVPDLSHRESWSYHLHRLLNRVSEQEALKEELAKMDWRHMPHIPDRDVVFTVRVDSFRIETTRTGRVSDYKTAVTIFDPDSIFSFVIEVNKPLVYKGYSFYQSSYGYLPRRVRWVRLMITDKGGTPVVPHVRLPFRKAVKIAGTPLTVTARDFVADFVYDIQTKTVSSRSREHRNPAVLIEVAREGREPFRQWLMLSGMMAHASKDEEYDFRVIDYEPEAYTVLEVRTHPLMGVIWTGFGLGAVGVFLSFYVTQRRVWVLARPEEGGCRLFVAAATRRDKESFSRNFARLVSELKKSAREPGREVRARERAKAGRA